MKPHFIQLLQKQRWKEANPDALKYISYENDMDVCFYFLDSKAFPEATSDPLYHLKFFQLCRSQFTVKKMEVTMDGESMTLFVKCSYCSEVKVCANDQCIYTVSEDK